MRGVNLFSYEESMDPYYKRMIDHVCVELWTAARQSEGLCGRFSVAILHAFDDAEPVFRRFRIGLEDFRKAANAGYKAARDQDSRPETAFRAVAALFEPAAASVEVAPVDDETSCNSFGQEAFDDLGFALIPA